MSFPAPQDFYSSNVSIAVRKLFHSLNKGREKKLGLDVDLLLMRL